MPKETLMAFPEAVAMQDNANSPEYPPSALFFFSRPLSRLKCQQAHKGEVQSVLHYKRIICIFNLYREIQLTCIGMDTKDVG